MHSEEVYKQVLPENYFVEFWKAGERNDGRAFSQVRDVTYERLSENSAIINFGGNVIQSSHSFFTDRFRIMPNDENRIFDLSSKISIEFEDYPVTELLESSRYLLINLITSRYSNVLTALPPNNGLKITLKCLFENGNLLNATCFASLLQFYLFAMKSYCFFLDQCDLFMPIITKGFYLAEKRATLWLADPSLDEEKLALHNKKGSTVLAFCKLGSKDKKLYKLSGGHIEENDLDSLEQVLGSAVEGIAQSLPYSLAQDQNALYKLK